jgi:hypothetical protein
MIKTVREIAGRSNFNCLSVFPLRIWHILDEGTICDAPRDFWPNDVIWTQDHKTEIGDQTQISSI